jgi:hypothetical protein
MFDAGGGSWNVPAGETARQAIAPLRGYAYQLHQSLAAWIRLPTDGVLYLEVAEDYATLVNNPGALDAVLEATQVKDTRNSGSVTLNSQDVLDAIEHLWALQEENPGQDVRLEFLTTSPIGKERRNGLPDGGPALSLWSAVGRDGPVNELRAALQSRFPDGTLGAFLQEAEDATLRARLLRPLTWQCGAADWAMIDQDNQAALVSLGRPRGGTPDSSRRAVNALLRKLLDTILSTEDRRLTRDELFETFDEAISVRVPSAVAAAALQNAMVPGREVMHTAPEWRDLLDRRWPLAPRTALVDAGAERLQRGAGLWLHGATGIGKTLLAEAIAGRIGGHWRVLDLRKSTTAVLVERLAVARGELAGDPALSGLIVDDLDPAISAAVGATLDQALDAAARRGLPIIVTAPAAPEPRLMRSARAEAGGVVAVPYLSEAEVAELVEIHGGAPEIWARFVFMAAAAGHPQLTDVLVSGLAERGWPVEEKSQWIVEGFTTVDVQATRTAARQRLFANLSENERAVLTRTAHLIGAFDRDLVLAVGAAEPPIPDAGWAFDRLAGRWIETIGGGRHRASPLVTGLARQVLADAERRMLDRTVVLHILNRRELTPELADMACMHTVSGEAHDVVAPIAHALLSLDSTEQSSVAAGMPLFRMLTIDRMPFLSQWPHAAVLWQLAQHNLIAAMCDDNDTERSVRSLLDALARIDAGAGRDQAELMVLSKVLLDDHAAGAIPDWPALVRRFEGLCDREDEFGGIIRDAGDLIGRSAVEFAFLMHAVKPRGVESLQALFADLDGLTVAERQRWLDVLRAEAALDALGMAIDQAWVRESQKEGFDPEMTERAFAGLAHQAEGWGEPDVAGKCHRARSILRDEYMDDPGGGLAVLDDAEARLPDSLDLRRARAKLIWRQNDHETALGLITEIAEEMVARGPLEAGFTLREAGISAGELGIWGRAESFFARAADAVAGLAEDRQIGFALGLRLDAIAACFSGGDRLSSIRQMAAALPDILALPRANDRRAVYTQHLARHLILWMDIAIDGARSDVQEAAEYFPGAGSNLEPPAAIDARPLSAGVTAWWLLSRAALRAGLPEQEVLAWPGIVEIADYAGLDVMKRQLLAELHIAAGELDGFEPVLREAVTALVFFGEHRYELALFDPIDPPRRRIPELDAAEFRADPAREHLRDAVLAMAARRVLESTAASDLQPLRSLAQKIAGIEIVPEWGGGEAENDRLDQVVACALLELSRGRPLPIDHIYMTHLRLFEWLSATTYRRVLEPVLAMRVRADWRTVLDTRRFLLRDPALHTDKILRTLDAETDDAAAIAHVLIAVEPATGINLTAEYRDRLRSTEDDAPAAAPATT